MNLSNIQNYSDQEIFNNVMDLLIQQNAKSRDAEGRCLYRGDEGRKCAVGLIMDEYKSCYENSGVRTIIEADYPNATNKITLLEVLQSVHDAHFPEEWPLIKVELYEILFNQRSVNDTKVAYNFYTMISILAYKAKNGASGK